MWFVLLFKYFFNIDLCVVVLFFIDCGLLKSPASIVMRCTMTFGQPQTAYMT